MLSISGYDSAFVDKSRSNADSGGGINRDGSRRNSSVSLLFIVMIIVAVVVIAMSSRSPLSPSSSPHKKEKKSTSKRKKRLRDEEADDEQVEEIFEVEKDDGEDIDMMIGQKEEDEKKKKMKENSIDERKVQNDRKKEDDTAPLPLPPPMKKKVELTKHFVSLKRNTNIMIARMHNIVRGIYEDKRDDLEAVVHAVAPYLCKMISSRQALTDESLRDLVTRLVKNRQWSLLGYLVLSLRNQETLLRAAGKQIVAEVKGMPEYSWGTLKLDLIFVSLMLSNSFDNLLDSSDCFFGDYFSSSEKSVSEIIGGLIGDYWRLMFLEFQNILYHARTETNVTMFTRYWQFIHIRNKHSHLIPSATANQIDDFYKHFIHLGFFVLGEKYLYQYDLIALQTIAHILNTNPDHFNDERGNLVSFAEKFVEKVFDRFTDIDVRTAFLPFTVDVDRYLMWDASSPLSTVERKVFHVPRNNDNELYFPYEGLQCDRLSKQLVAMNRTFDRYVVLNRQFAPLPSITNAFDRANGRIYLGNGLVSAVSNFLNIDKHYLVAIEDAENDLARHLETVYFVHTRYAFEGYSSSFDFVPKLRLKGGVCIDTLTGRFITNLIVQTVQAPLAEALRNYRGWLSYVLLSFLHNHLVSRTYHDYLEETIKNPAELALTRKFLEIGFNVYATAINRLKTDICRKALIDRSARQQYRHALNVTNTSPVPPAPTVTPDVHFASESSWYEEFIDFDSTQYADGRRAVSLYEQKLWDEELGITHENALATSFRKFCEKSGVGPIAQNRLISVMILTFDSLKRYDAINGFQELYRMYTTRNQSSSAPLSHLSSLPPFTSECSLPFCAIIYSTSLRDMYSVPSTPNEKILAAATYEVSIDCNGKEIMRKSLRPLTVPPYALNNMSLDELDRSYDVQHEVSTIDLQAQPLFRQNSRDQIFLFVWKRTASGKLTNVVTLRVINKDIDEFKIFNVLWDKSQYLVVRQASKKGCTAASFPSENISTVSKLWYTVCTSEKDEKASEQKRYVKVGRRHYFHMLTLDEEQFEATKGKYVRAPALLLIDTTEKNNLKSVIEDKYRRSGFVRRVVPSYDELLRENV